MRTPSKLQVITIILFIALSTISSCANKKKEPANENDSTKGGKSMVVTDACGNTYNYVKIGEQYWMAENMRCNKYDTGSERAGAGLSEVGIITYAPYYNDGRAANTDYSGNLSNTQREKLGLLYNWAAAVGLSTASEAQNQTDLFSGNRQGICPNGWHVPREEEWIELEAYIENNTSGKYGAGKHLKTVSGWYYKGSNSHAGLDTYKFSALPAGDAGGSTEGNIGALAAFWYADPVGPRSDEACSCDLNYNEDLLLRNTTSKKYALSVRCMKNENITDNESQSSEVNISFKQSLYKIEENYLDLDLKNELNVTPVSILETEKITWAVSDKTIAEMAGNFLVPKRPGDVKITATIAGVEAVCNVTVLNRESQSSLTLNDVCGNTYNYVKIGSQYWMAENMRCNKYDTQSERAGATISTTNSGTCAPYYADASNKSLWKSTGYAKELTDTQIAKLGFLYNWAAAVGIATAKEAETQVSNFRGNRQGICPNGWHIPTSAEWDALGIALENSVSDLRCFNKTGDMLRTTTGWFAVNGTDECSFAALPAGNIEAGKTTIDDVGFQTFFWTATPESKDYANYLFLHVSLCSAIHKKGNAYSVRCVKD